MNTNTQDTSQPASASRPDCAPPIGSVSEERCESGCDAPVVGHDAEGIPLCRECIDSLNREFEEEELKHLRAVHAAASDWQMGRLDKRFARLNGGVRKLEGELHEKLREARRFYDENETD